MRRAILVCAFIILFIFTLFGQSEPASKPTPILLTPDEQKEIAVAAQIAEQTALQAEIARLRAEIARRDATAILEKHRKAHGCEGCLYDDKYASLVKVEKK